MKISASEGLARREIDRYAQIAVVELIENRDSD